MSLRTNINTLEELHHYLVCIRRDKFSRYSTPRFGKELSEQIANLAGVIRRLKRAAAAEERVKP